MHPFSPALALVLGVLPVSAVEPGPSPWSAAQEDIAFPQRSPWASVRQTIGTTVIAIDYHRPAVRGRPIWGSLVPYHQVWRAGANEATTIRFSDDVRIQGQDVRAGTYSLFMIPRPDIWTVILNRRAKQWGAFEYDPRLDVLRIDVRPRANGNTNWLTYTLDPNGESAAYVEFQWEKVKVSFLVELDVEAITTTRMKKLFSQRPGDWKVYCEAAEYGLQQKVALPQAFAWVERSLALQRNPTNLAVKARLHFEAGQKSTALTLMQSALDLARKRKDPRSLTGPLEADLAAWQQGH
jgi:hypothetical protein